MPKKVEILYWPHCPSFAEAHQLVLDVAAEAGTPIEVGIREINTLEEAVSVGFVGSPTILVDGRDVDESSAFGRPSLSCRLYRLPDGRPSPIPSRSQIKEALS